ncbi:MAG: T9SS type A sorting domain-containing protein [Bacteroidales bacterium]|nr:T9SS type A sorting domain-containing protein [Bacteroidales bacterium]
MKDLLNLIRLAALLLMCAVGFHAGAQEDRVTPPDPNPGSRQYNVVINSDFESKCVLPNDGQYYYDELPHVLVACQGQEVTYTAYASTDGDNVVSWSWLVTGAASVSYNDNVATVLWGTEESGMLSVTITMASGYTCTRHQAVRIVEKPVAVASSVPEYDASHTIYVCYGMDVEFTDQSHTQSSDIAGYLWEGCGSTSSTRSFLLQNVTTPCTVTHRVYNNCGCYDEEEFLIKVLQGHPLQLDCYGTACEGSTVSYHATSPSCTQYFWSIEGGHLVSGQGTPDITVTWDNPLDGYGIISLDGPICGNGACQGGLSVRVPIIQNGVAINGQTAVCEGEAVVYSVPLYGSTHYEWSITPSTGVSVTPLNGANKVTCLFNTPDTFRISVKYKCDFLACGEFRSDTLTVVVKPRLEILGDKEVCRTNTITLTTNDENNNLFTWNVYDLANNQLIYTSPSPTDQLASNVIQNAGRYRITAENSNYCNEATFVLTIKDPPPAPTVAEMSPDNPTIACPNSTIRLNATPSNPYYNFIWEACSTATPAVVSGEEVSITYGSEVCNVNVYHYDRELQCRSRTSYTHTVVPFVLAQTHLPKRITVCPGTRIVWGNDIVPEQDLVLYEWQIQDLYQRYITVDGDIHSGPNTFTVSDINPAISNPISFQLYLSRRYCGDEKIDTVQIIIYPMQHPSLSFDPQDAICQNSQVQLSGSGCTTCVDANAIGRYTWSFSDSPQTATGQTIYHTFDKPGDILVTLTCNPYDVCDNSNYLPSVTGIIKVIPNPPAYSIGYDGTNVFLEPPLSSTDYAIRWGHTADTNNTVPASLGGGMDYSCMIISRTNPRCTTMIKNEAVLCQPLQLGPPSIDYCNKTVSFSVLNPPMPIVWSVLSGDVGDQIINGSLNEYLTLPVNSVGNIVVKARAEADEPCFSSTTMFTVDFLPYFSLQKACSTIVIRNNSKYLDGSKMLQINVKDGNGIILNNLIFPVSQSEVTYPTGGGGHFTFELYSYDGTPLVPPCTIGSVDIQNTSDLPLPVNVTSANTGHIHQTCDNTAIQLTASLPSPHTIVHSHWDFDDGGTYLDTNGNSVYHTFEFRSINTDYSLYMVTVDIKDENGCEHQGRIEIKSFENELKDESIYINALNFPICPGNDVTLEYQINDNTPPTDLIADYDWSSSPNNNSYLHYVSYTDDYSVIVTNDNYCKTEASVNVRFKNKPSAIIIPKKYYYCTGEEIVLYGKPDNENNYTYAWSVYESIAQTTIPYTTGTIRFTAPSYGCTYTINLTITNDEGCSAQADPVTITVVAPPLAPGISKDPNQHCIDQHPFKLISNNPSQLLHWSNGDYGNTAYYHYPGPAIAYYYDPVSGCRSDSAVINIPAAPDFDALLTGCYKVCDSLSETSLPVYGLLPLLQPYGWDWYYNNLLSQNGLFGYQPHPLMLPLSGFGSYHLSVNYFEDCQSTSKPFVLQEDDVCKCDSIDIRYVCKDSHVKDCHLIYEIEVTVCNNSHTTRTFNTLTPLFNLISGNITITSNTFTATSITPSNCYNFTLELEVSILDPMVASFMIEGSKCNVDFSIDLTPDINCSQLASGSITPNSTITGVNTIYCDFSINVSGVTDVLAVWSNPQSVVNYTLTGTGVSGLCAFGQGDLSDGETACVYALVCVDKELCIYYYCVPVADLLASPKSSPLERAGRDADNSPDPTLKPNPTTGDVSVVGTSDKVLEILVMDMNGRTVATFTGSDHFNISNLPSAAYIVRIKTSPSPLERGTAKPGGMSTTETPAKITYLKLIKK